MEFLRGWYEYFVLNSEREVEIEGEEEGGLDEEEKRLIGKSIAAFQLGEYSEGKGLLRSAEAFARAIDDEYLVRTTKLFIAEEQGHAILLQKFMLRHGIPQMKRHWADTIFRRLRRHVGFEFSITVLITAEIIALVYYRALSACTGSNQLKDICGRILSDESSHVRYESELIKLIRERRPEIYRVTVEFLHRLLFSGTVLVVYAGHRRVLDGGGYQFYGFWSASWREFSKCFSGQSERRVRSVGMKVETAVCQSEAAVSGQSLIPEDEP